MSFFQATASTWSAARGKTSTGTGTENVFKTFEQKKTYSLSARSNNKHKIIKIDKKSTFFFVGPLNG